MTEKIHTVLYKKKLDQDVLDSFEDMLILSDFGVHLANQIRQQLHKEKFNKEVSEDEIKIWLADYIESLLEPYAKPLSLNHIPHVVFISGVNGVGKTTSIAKMAYYYKEQGKKIHVAACDTFRAAAVEQLEVWSKRIGFTLHKRPEGSDAAALAFDALQECINQKGDILFIDTAGRLHNKKNLMDEISKMIRVLKKIDETAPHTSLLVIDATTGQNALQQIEHFQNIVGINGIALTKLDGTAKGGIIAAIVEKFKLPIHFIGVGEQKDDLRPFNPKQFAKNLLNLPLDEHSNH